MEPEQLAKYQKSRRDGKVVEKKDGVLKARDRKLTAEGLGFPGFVFQMWVLGFSNGRTNRSWISPPVWPPVPSPQCQGVGRVLRGGVVFWGLLTAASSADLAGGFTGCSGISGIQEVEPEVTGSFSTWFPLH